MFKLLTLTSLLIVSANCLASAPKPTLIRSDSGRHFFSNGKPVSSVEFYLAIPSLPETRVEGSTYLVAGKPATKAEFDTVNNVCNLCVLNYRRALSTDSKELITINQEFSKLSEKLNKQMRAEKAAAARSGCILS